MGELSASERVGAVLQEMLSCLDTVGKGTRGTFVHRAAP